MVARAAQKHVEKQKLQEAMANMQEDWHASLSESLRFKSRKQLAAELIPEANGEKKDQDDSCQKQVFAGPELGNTFRSRPIVLA
jgi:hypothetical protein